MRNELKTLKRIISWIVVAAFAISTVCNILFLLDKVSEVILQIAFWILLIVIFLVSVLGIILKNIRHEQYVSINIITPAKELGLLYTGLVIVWAVTYFVTIIFK